MRSKICFSVPPNTPHGVQDLPCCPTQYASWGARFALLSHPLRFKGRSIVCRSWRGLQGLVQQAPKLLDLSGVARLLLRCCRRRRSLEQLAVQHKLHEHQGLPYSVPGTESSGGYGGSSFSARTGRAWIVSCTSSPTSKGSRQ